MVFDSPSEGTSAWPINYQIKHNNYQVQKAALSLKSDLYQATYQILMLLYCYEMDGSPELVSAALVDPQRGGQTTLSASQVAAGSKRHRTVEFGTTYKRHPDTQTVQQWTDTVDWYSGCDDDVDIA
ncbi:jg13704 [Pararge aegeria aegeria]|uniref:Jg13704 protein n=1 Tax=Pararge aegeria aegeria TaxID=348720 RepID=A0A8S4RRT0_9NEOP|nr:jg13704 [Pararge aegeria aegeria]